MTTFATASDIINTALQELGMGVVSIEAAAADATGYQMLGLLNALGDEVLRSYDWQVLEKTHTFICPGGVSEFDMPSDFGRTVNQTEWAASDNRPLQGPVSPQVWAWNKYGIVSVGVYYQYRMIHGALNIFPEPAAGTEIAFYYITKNWVAEHGLFYEGRDKVVFADDIVGFDRRLMIAGLKLKFWAAKGLDTTTLKSEFDYMLSNEKSATTGAAVISLTGSNVNPLLGWNNIMDGNWNQ